MCKAFSTRIFIAALLLAAASFPALGQSNIKVEWLRPQQHDFGVLAQSNPATHAFAFRNSSAAPLVIDNVRTPCGCTAAAWPEAPLAPGEMAEIVIAFNAAQPGYFRKEIKVFFRGIRGAQRLAVMGEVE